MLVIEKSSGARWVDEATGVTLVARGNAGPERWWWHVRRGITPPSP